VFVHILLKICCREINLWFLKKSWINLLHLFSILAAVYRILQLPVT